MKEGVDISYTKSKGIDDNPYNVNEPLINQLLWVGKKLTNQRTTYSNPQNHRKRKYGLRFY